MELIIDSLFALVVLALGLFGFILSLILLELNKTKFFISLILSLVLIGLGGYNYYRILTSGQNINLINIQSGNIPAAEPTVLPTPEARPETDSAPATGVTVVLEVNGVKKELRDDEHLSVKKGTKIKIIDGLVAGQDPKLIRVNLTGFIGDSNNLAEDRGYLIDTSALLKKFSVDKKGNTYKIELLVGKKTAGTVFVDLKE